MLSPEQLDRIDVILVSPRNPLNIGAAARAMANFGFQRLSIVAPFAQNWMEAKSAVGAPGLLREAKVYNTLAEAIAHCTLVLGTGSLDRRRPEQAILGLPEAAIQIRQTLHQPAQLQPQDTNTKGTGADMKGTGFSPYINPPRVSGASAPEGRQSPGAPGLDDRGSHQQVFVGGVAETWDSADLPKSNPSHIALVFGSEKHGLTSDDLSWCHALIVIETHDDQPSMNLGQAVAVCLYEISRTPESSAQPSQTSSSQPSQAQSIGSAASAQLDRLASLVEETMEAVNYSTRGMRSANGQALRILLRRLMPNEPDLRRMMGLFRRILWQLGRGSGKV